MSPDWSAEIESVEAEFDRAEQLAERVRDRPGVAEANRDGSDIELFFDDATSLPGGFHGWMDEQGVVIRDVTVIPEIDGFRVLLAFADAVEALSPQARAADRLAGYYDAGANATAALDAWMCDDGPFTQAEWARVRGVGRQTVGDRVRGARRKLADAEGR